MGPNLLKSLNASIPATVYQFVVTKNGGWRFDYISPRVVDIYGVSQEAAMLDHSALTSRIHPDDAEDHRASVEHAVAVGCDWAHLHRIITPEGITKWILAQATPRKALSGDVIWSGVLVDVSWLLEREATIFHIVKEFEATLREFESKINQRSADLEYFRRSLIKKASPTRGQTVGTVALRSADEVATRSETTASIGAARKSGIKESGLTQLSPREDQVLACLARGLSSKAIAAELSIALPTVAAHRRNIKRKIRTRNSTDLSNYALLKFPSRFSP